MRFATFATDTGPVTAGVVVADLIHPIAGTVLDLVRGGLESALAIGTAAVNSAEPISLAAVRLLPPLQPPTIRDFVAFEEHVEGVRRSIDGVAGVPEQWYAAPTFYFTSPYALIGAHDEVPIPAGCTLFDYELEVAAVLGNAGSDLSAEQGRDAIFGYTILNDWSARDLQGREMKVGLGPAKGKDFASTLGPWLVTADEVAARHDADGFLPLLMTVQVNGVEIGRDLLSNMGWPMGELVSYASRGAHVRPGDVLGSGTCGNGGCLAELWGRRGSQDPPPLKAGDVVTMTVDGIGSISNRVVAGPAPTPIAPARKRPRSRV